MTGKEENRKDNTQENQQLIQQDNTQKNQQLIQQENQQKTQQEKSKKSKNANRLRLLDAFRGLTILSMIAFHTCWDLYSFGLGISYQMLYSNAGYWWQQSICWSFILLSGFCFSLGRRHLRQGLMVFGAGILVSVVTILATYDSRVIFGVLTLLGSCSLLMCLLDRIMPQNKTGAAFALAICLTAFIVTKSVSAGYLGFEGFRIMELPSFLYQGYGMAFLGFPFPGFFSTDYFGLIPWLFLYMSGYFIEKLVRGSGFFSFCKRYGCRPLEFLGRHSLVIYLAHQVVVYAVVYLISLMVH